MDHHGGAPAVEVFDPLCPSCRAFETRLVSSGMDAELHRTALLFPLDNECNWMLTEKKHPGACAISEAVLCAGDKARDVIDWAFSQQDAIKAAAAASGDRAREMAKQRFPELAQCIGSPVARSRLNKSLRWAVRNQIAVLTPQLYVDGVKLCDEDTDLGLDFMLTRMIQAQHDGTLKTRGAK
jgi:protein-disulfide isomerase